MKQIFRILVALLLIGQPALADQVEIDADATVYGATIFFHEACEVEIVVVAPGVDKIYVGGDLIAMITIVDDKLGYVDAYQGDLLVSSHSYAPNDELSVMSKDVNINQMLDYYGVPPLSELGPISCLSV
ncbi:MAG: hypothetical protein ACI9SY_000063 [Candidatus Paceibacteria bacterium]|jgi:hypothetical protein